MSREFVPIIGTRVRSKVYRNGEEGYVEEIRKDGQPLVRWDYGQLLRATPSDLDILSLMAVTHA